MITNINTFIKEFDKINNGLEYSLEYGLKISNEKCTNNKINIKFRTDKDTFKNIIINLFDNPDNTCEFIDYVYDNYENVIINQYIGFLDGNKEAYFELVPLDTPEENKYITNTWIYSYDENTGVISQYDIFNNSYNEILSDYIINKFNLNISNLLQPWGYIKNDDIFYYILSFVDVNECKEILTELCLKINNTNPKIIEDFFNNHYDKKVSIIGYNIDENDNLILNIYTK
jgi:hypothetical protein